MKRAAPLSASFSALLASLALLALFGCQALLGVDFDDAHPREADDASPAVSVEAEAGEASAARPDASPRVHCPASPAEATSDYTDATALDAGGTYDCGTRGDFTLFETIGATATVQIAYPGGLFDVPVVAPDASLGPKIEWRGTVKGGSLVPYAVIYRYLRYNASVGRQHHSLVVIKLTADVPCVYAIVEASKQSGTANALAREAADRACADVCPDTVPPLPPEVWN